MKGHFSKRTYIDRNGKARTASTWTVWYDEPVAANERRRQKSKSGFKTRKEAEAWFNRTADQLRRGIVAIDEKTTLAQFLESWLVTTEQTISASAFHSYRNHVELHLIPTLGSIRLRDLRPSHIESAKTGWLTAKRKDGRSGTLSARTAKHIYSTLNVALNRAKRQHLIIANPCELVDPPRFERHEMRSLDAEQAVKLLGVFEDSEMGAAIVVALGSGLRRGELLALRWADVDLERGTLSVGRSAECVGGVVRYKEPKTKRSRRTISLPAFAIERLRRHRLEQAERFLAIGLGRAVGETLIFERNGEPWIPNTFGVRFMTILRKSGLPRVRLHDLRHSYASMALAAGIDLKTVSTALGHSTIATTADIYAHVTPAMLQSAADRLDQTLGAELRRVSGDGTGDRTP